MRAVWNDDILLFLAPAAKWFLFGKEIVQQRVTTVIQLTALKMQSVMLLADKKQYSLHSAR